jgi:uncharacterized protein DUF3307
MPWVEIFIVFVVCHMTGDFLLQTEWQARNKRGGLGGNPLARRALVSHIATYTLAFVPALVWLADDLGAGVLALAALIAAPHLVQDDGRLVTAFMVSFKGVGPEDHPNLALAVDQSFHVLALFGAALVAGG